MSGKNSSTAQNDSTIKAISSVTFGLHCCQEYLLNVPPAFGFGAVEKLQIQLEKAVFKLWDVVPS